MKYMPDWQAAYLLDILNSADAIGCYVGECDREAFLRDAKTQDAVLRRLMVIGEAAARLTWFTTTARLISKLCGMPLLRICLY